MFPIEQNKNAIAQGGNFHQFRIFLAPGEVPLERKLATSSASGVFVAVPILKLSHGINPVR
jgi:hypothetical protein